jgi:hypothetical protein
MYRPTGKRASVQIVAEVKGLEHRDGFPWCGKDEHTGYCDRNRDAPREQVSCRSAETGMNAVLCFKTLVGALGKPVARSGCVPLALPVQY